MTISSTSIDGFIWAVKKYMMSHYGCESAEREIYPLVWYVSTGRASGGILSRLLEAKPYMIGRLLHKGGSVDEAVERVISYVGGR